MLHGIIYTVKEISFDKLNTKGYMMTKYGKTIEISNIHGNVVALRYINKNNYSWLKKSIDRFNMNDEPQYIQNYINSYFFNKELIDSNKLPYFEIELNNGDYELFHITIENSKIYANNLFINTDYDFSLDENLQELYEVCLNYLSNKGLL